jgi:hypothetical protein
MYFKVSGRTNPTTNKCDSYYRLVESYRNTEGRVCHRTILNVGFIEDQLTSEQLNLIARTLTDIYQKKQTLFRPSDELVNKWVRDLWSRIVGGQKLDLTVYDERSRMVSVDTMRHSNVREIGSEWMCYNVWHQLGLDQVLEDQDFSELEIQLAQTQVISRAVNPASELATTRWIEENSAIGELTGYPMEKMNKDRLYKSALKLNGIKEKLEQHLSIKTNELFDIQDKILLYDLTNTYFEGEKRNSKLAKFGRSKEKRNDAKLVVLALVVNMHGFIKYSSIHAGGTKTVDKVHQRIGRAKQKYPSVHMRYTITVTNDDHDKNVQEITWEVDQTKNKDKTDELGKYFLRTSLDMQDEVLIWNVYNTIREIESTFKTLKTDLDLRPIYHKNDDSTIAHLNLGLLAYWIVNTIRCQLRSSGITSNWKEIVRIGNTQKVITTSGYNKAGKEVTVRKCSQPELKLRALHQALSLPPRPFTKLKSVVHRPKLKNLRTESVRTLGSG